MTVLMDRLFIKIGFDAGELEACKIRSALYIGMTYTVGMASAFMIMAALS